MRITLEQINEILASQDIEGLIEAGAPDDEYSGEAQKIYDILSLAKEDELNIQPLVLILNHLWQRSFNLTRQDMINRSEAITALAESIFRTYR